AAVGIAVGCAVSITAETARAECPKSGSPDSACRYFSGLFIPTASGIGYFPGSDGLGPWFGGGLQVVIYGWSDNSKALGPSQGKIRFDANVLGSPASDAKTMVMFSGGGEVSFEGNASRSWLIPNAGFNLGLLHEATLETRGFIEPTLGIFALYTPRVIIDIGGGYVIPFTDVDKLLGPSAHLTVS